MAVIRLMSAIGLASDIPKMTAREQAVKFTRECLAPADIDTPAPARKAMIR